MGETAEQGGGGPRRDPSGQGPVRAGRGLPSRRGHSAAALTGEELLVSMEFAGGRRSGQNRAGSTDRTGPGRGAGAGLTVLDLT